jgi:O-antigen/teichoic acid export membrane protein
MYGLFLLGLSVVNLTAGLADCGLRWGVLRWASMAWGRGDRAELKATMVAGMAFGLGASLLAGALVALGGWLWAASWFKAPDLGWLLPWLAFSIPATALTMLMVSAFQALRRFTVIALLLHGLDPFLRIVIFMALHEVGWQVGAAMVSHVVATIVVALVAFSWLRYGTSALTPEVRSRYSVGPLLAFSLPLLLANLAGLVLQWADTLIVGTYLSARDVGIYGMATRLATLSGMFLAALGSVFAPQIYALYASKNLSEVARLYRQSTRWIIALGLPVFLFTVLNAQHLLALFGQEFVEGRWALIVLALASLVVGGTGAAGDIVFMVGRSRAALWTSLLVTVVALALNLWLVPQYGILGAAIGSGSALALGNFINVVQGWWFTGFHPYHRSMLRPISLALGVAALQWWIAGAFSGPALLMVGAAALVWVVIYPPAVVCVGLPAEDRLLWDRLLAQLRPRAARL